MAEAGRHQLLRLPCRAHQQPGTGVLPVSCHQPLAAHAPAPQPKGRHDLGPDQEAGRRLSPQTQDPSPLAERAFRRQTPKVGAGCPNWARPDLCGGMPAMAFPTAISHSHPCLSTTGNTRVLSLSRLNHWLPRGQANPEVMQGTADFHHAIPDTLLPQAALTTRQRLTLLLTCSIRSRREWSAWLAVCCARGRSAPGGFLVGMRISTWGSVKARKPRSCNNRLPAGKGYGVASASRLS